MVILPGWDPINVEVIAETPMSDFTQVDICGRTEVNCTKCIKKLSSLLLKVLLSLVIVAILE